MPRTLPMAALDAQPHATGAEVTVLVVDDERTVRNVVQRTLRLQGYDVLDAADAAAALTLLGTAAGRIRIMVTDDRMPGMSGRELAAIVARVYPSVRVILMSGNPGGTGQEDVMGVLVLPKPFSLQALITVVHDALWDPPAPPAD